MSVIQYRRFFDGMRYAFRQYIMQTKPETPAVLNNLSSQSLTGHRFVGFYIGSCRLRAEQRVREMWTCLSLFVH